MAVTNQLPTHHALSSGAASVHPANHEPIVYFGISIKRLVCLFILTLGFYRFYWFYKNWKAIKEAEQSDISPFWRSFFGIFFCQELFEYIARGAEKYSNKRLFSPSRLATWYIIWLTIGSFIGLGFLIIFLLIKAQRAILFNNAQVIPNYKPIKKFTNAELIFIAIGGLIWFIGLTRAIFEPEDRHAATKNWITFQPESKDFKIKFPTAPTQEAEQLPVDDTDLHIDYTSYNSVGKDGVYYSVSRMVYPSEVDLSKIELEDLIQEIVESSAGNKLVTSKKTQMQGYRAADFFIQFLSDRNLKGRMVVVGQTQYLLTVTYDEDEEISGRDYKRFIRSFFIKVIK